jgi:hypothetical protein
MEEYNRNDLNTIILFLYNDISQNLLSCWECFLNDMGKVRCVGKSSIRSQATTFKNNTLAKYDNLGFDCFSPIEQDGIKSRISQKLQKKVNNTIEIHEKISYMLNQNQKEKLCENIAEILAPLLISETKVKIKKSKNVSTSKNMD